MRPRRRRLDPAAERRRAQAEAETRRLLAEVLGGAEAAREKTAPWAPLTPPPDDPPGSDHPHAPGVWTRSR